MNIARKTGASIRKVCQTLQLPRSSFYEAAEPSASALADQKLGDLIEEIFRTHRRRYGVRRIHEELTDRGVQCAHSRIRKLMRQRGLKAIQPRNFIPRTSDGRADAPAENLVESHPEPQGLNEIWVGDITYIPTAQGWLYLAVVIDLCSRKIIGWNLENHMRAGLVIEALDQALQSRTLSSGTIFHSDRGSQYGSAAFRALLAKANMLQSMSGRANPYDNAWSESLIATLKRELIGEGQFDTAQDAQIALFDYIESYYNTQRKHSSIDYKTPFQFENNLLKLN